MLMIVPLPNNKLTHSKDVRDFLNYIKDYGNDFTLKQIILS